MPPDPPRKIAPSALGISALKSKTYTTVPEPAITLISGCLSF